MNFLGHASFSPPNPGVLTGNMISDFVKGRQQYSYPPDMQRGILLHRAIDTYIDAHPAAKAAREPFRAAYRLYAGPMVDVAFDYFVANDPLLFPTDESLLLFSTRTYAALQTQQAWMPERFAGMFVYMQAQNWLYNYRFDAGMRQSFGGLVRRAAYLQDAETAYLIFMAEKPFLQDCYQTFMADFGPWYAAHPLVLG